MEDFYPFTIQDLPQLSALIKKEDDMFHRDMNRNDGNVVSFLLGLVIDLFSDVNEIRRLKTRFQQKYSRRNRNRDGNENEGEQGFLEIVRTWLKENDGTGNLLRLIEALRSNSHLEIAHVVEQLLIRYSLPNLDAAKSSKDNSLYFLSRDFLKEEEKKDASLSASGCELESVSSALQNSVILEEIFKKLGPKDQKLFRLVSPTWMKETFSYWRRVAKIQLQVSKDYQSGLYSDDSEEMEKENQGFFIDYVNLVELNRNMPKQEGDEFDESNFNLAKYPFHCYQLSYGDYDGYGDQGTPFSYGGEIEERFWQLCGSHIEDLQIDNASFRYKREVKSVHGICERILLNCCLNLKKLKISRSCAVDDIDTSEESSSDSDLEGRERAKKDKTQDKINFIKKQNVALNLHTLNLEIPVQTLNKILFLCPNLKTLLILNNEDEITGLLHPTANGDYIKLEKLTMRQSAFPFQSLSFLSLRQYTKLLTKENSKSLQYIHLNRIFLMDARQSPFNLYAALAQSGNNLKTLNLELHVTRDNLEEEEGSIWFTDLSPFPFPTLTSLRLCFHCDFSSFPFRLSTSGRNPVLKFDFGTLKGMPLLEQLEIKVKNLGGVLRNPGIQDWVFEGNRNRYLPDGVTVDYFYSEDDPIQCKNLKEFKFIGWKLNEEDIILLSTWFPNLTRLIADVNPEHLALLVEKWERLEHVEIKTERLISLSQLRPLKEKRKRLRIIQTIYRDGLKYVELMEYNGRLYFSDIMIHDYETM